MTNREFRTLGREMRAAQKAYFKARRSKLSTPQLLSDLMSEAKRLEGAFDAELKANPDGEQGTFFEEMA